MATVFMKWLETSPQDYDRGIQLLTLGRLTPLKAQIARDYVQPGTRVLEIGCGTGTLTQMMAERGAVITGIDASPIMLAEAEAKIAESGLDEQVTLQQMDASLVGEKFEPGTFDLIVSTLVFSELPLAAQQYVLAACAGLLAENGRLLIADEAIPNGRLARFLFFLIRLPLVLLTWLLTRTTTAALRDFDNLLTEAGFHPRRAESHLGGSLVLFTAVPAASQSPITHYPLPILRHRPTLRTRLLDLWLLFFRIAPPYPKV